MGHQLAEAGQVVAAEVDQAALGRTARPLAEALGEPLGGEAEGQAVDTLARQLGRLVVGPVVVFDRGEDGAQGCDAAGVGEDRALAVVGLASEGGVEPEEVVEEFLGLEGGEGAVRHGACG
jgi:hypothetical protein